MRVEVASAGESLAPPAPRPARPSWPVAVPVPRVVIVGLRSRRGLGGPALGRGGCGLDHRRARQASESAASRTWPAFIAGNSIPNPTTVFGEGGAGTYSDGKLYTRSKDRVGVAGVLARPRGAGAPADITIDARPTHWIIEPSCRGCWRRCARVCRAWACTTSSTACARACAQSRDGSARCRQVPEKFLPIWFVLGARALGARRVHLGRSGQSGAAAKGHRCGGSHRAPASGHRPSSVRSRRRPSALAACVLPRCAPAARAAAV